MKFQPFNRKSQLQRVLESVGDSLDVPSGVKSNLSSKATKAGLITAGGLAALTAASAGISSLRNRTEGSRDGS
jgi:hypothetical protein